MGNLAISRVLVTNLRVIEALGGDTRAKGLYSSPSAQGHRLDACLVLLVAHMSQGLVGTKKIGYALVCSVEREPPGEVTVELLIRRSEQAHLVEDDALHRAGVRIGRLAMHGDIGANFALDESRFAGFELHNRPVMLHDLDRPLAFHCHFVSACGDFGHLDFVRPGLATASECS